MKTGRLQKAGQWCKERWKSIGKIVLAIVIVAALVVFNLTIGNTLSYFVNKNSKKYVVVVFFYHGKI